MFGVRPWIVLLCAAPWLSGCTEEADSASGRRTVAAAAEQEPLPDWLTVNDAMPPEQWLAAQRLHRDGLDKADIATLLQQAAQRFQENPRMLANRAYQLQQMLSEAGMPEDAVALIERFMTLPERPDLIGFSANCQHYFNLRQQGLDPDSAFEHLVNHSLPVPID